jgi:hypothetical protein
MPKDVMLPLPLATEQRSMVGPGWARNSVNAVIFRKNSLTTSSNTQFIAYYDNDGYIMLGKRNLDDANWQVQKTQYRGDAADAHKTINIIVDGDGYLHIAWNHHYTPLNYCKSTEPYSLSLTNMQPMTGNDENSITYSEFYHMADGNLLFFYRDMAGNIVVNKYDITTKKWSRLLNNLISGHGGRSAYWQAYIDSLGNIQLSWVWRESSDIETNHDLCYAISKDGGKTWQTSTGKKYALPITASNAEYAMHIPQNSDLINQTSMSADNEGHPYIATYWRDSGAIAPQYHLVYKTGNEWQVYSLNFRTKNFNLSGIGTKSIPISRPQIILSATDTGEFCAIIFRDQERGNRISVAVCKDLNAMSWNVFDLTNQDVGEWEPTFDLEQWEQNKTLDLFVQKVAQADNEGITNMPPQDVWVLQWQP